MNKTVEILLPGAEALGDKKVRLAPRLETLSGKTIGLINNDWISLDLTYEELQALLRGKHEVGDIIEKRKLKSSPLPPADLKELAEKADAVISALGN